MNSHRRFTRMGLLLSGPLMLLVSIGPGFAITGDDYGPLYTSSQTIMEAQSVLKAEHYLPAAEPRTGKMDGPTVKALKDFQRDHFIPASGRLDQETMAQLATHEEVMRAARADSTRTERVALSAHPAAASQGQSSASGTGSSEQRAAHRTMPETASPIPLMTALGALLAALGLILMRRARA